MPDILVINDHILRAECPIVLRVEDVLDDIFLLIEFGSVFHLIGSVGVRIHGKKLTDEWQVCELSSKHVAVTALFLTIWTALEGVV